MTTISRRSVVLANDEHQFHLAKLQNSDAVMTSGDQACSSSNPGNGKSDRIVMDGDVLHPMSFGIDEFQQLESRNLPPFDLQCYRTKKILRCIESYEGVLLRSLLSIVGLAGELHDFKRTIYVARALDGYALTFSWHEIFNTEVGDKVIVAHRCGGKSLTKDDGVPYLISGADIYSGPRHMKTLRSITAQIVR